MCTCFAYAAFTQAVPVPAARDSSSASPQAVADLSQEADAMEGQRLEDAQKEAEKVTRPD